MQLKFMLVLLLKIQASIIQNFILVWKVLFLQEWNDDFDVNVYKFLQKLLILSCYVVKYEIFIYNLAKNTCKISAYIVLY